MNIFKKSFMQLILISFAFNLVNAEESTNLDAIEVNAVSTLGSTTENSGSYTTGSSNSATGLDLSLRETPQTVLVYTQENLKDRSIESFQDLLAKTTGVTLNKWDERVYPTARGFSVDYYLFDGVPTYDLMSANDVDLIVFDRVEVVKGANGLTVGAGNPSMGMNFIRKHANSDKLLTDFTWQAGSWNNYSTSLDIQNSLNKNNTVRGRFIFKHQDQKSYMDYYKKKSDVVYAVIDADLTDKTFLSIGAGYNNLDRSGTRWGGLPAFYTDGTKTNFDRSKIVSNNWTYWNVESANVFADLTQYVNDNIYVKMSLSRRDYTTKTKSAYFNGKYNKETNLGEGDFYRYASETRANENNINLYSSYTFEFNHLSNELILGAMYNIQNTTKNNFVYANITNQELDIFKVPEPTQWTTYAQNSLNNTTQKAIYFASKLNPFQDFKIIAGARLSSWQYKKEDNTENRSFNNEFTPYIGAIYDLNANHSIYISYTNIFSPQEYKDVNGKYLDPSKGNSYETGIKGEYFDGYLNASLSLFKIKQDGVGEEIEGVNVVGTIESAYRAVSGVTSQGVEFSASGKINDNLDLDFAITNFEAKDSSGNKYNTTSSRTASNLFLKYSISKFKAGIGINYKSKYYTGSGDSQITQDAFFTSDLMLGSKINKNFDLQINFNNIFDKKYYDAIGSDSMVFADPRNVMATLKYVY